MRSWPVTPTRKRLFLPVLDTCRDVLTQATSDSMTMGPAWRESNKTEDPVLASYTASTPEKKRGQRRRDIERPLVLAVNAKVECASASSHALPDVAVETIVEWATSSDPSCDELGLITLNATLLDDDV